MSQKILVLTSGSVSVLLFIFNWIGTYTLCGGVEYGSCMDIAYSGIISLSPIIPLFIFALISLSFRPGTYAAWFRFVRWWIPLSVLAILVSPQYSSDWMFPIEKGSVALAMSVIFVVVSLLIIGIKFFRRPTA